MGMKAKGGDQPKEKKYERLEVETSEAVCCVYSMALLSVLQRFAHSVGLGVE